MISVVPSLHKCFQQDQIYLSGRVEMDFVHIVGRELIGPENILKVGGGDTQCTGQAVYVAAAEIAAAAKGIETLGGKLEKIEKRELILPDGTQSRTLILIKKVRETPIAYPRMYSKIIKKPL